MKRILIFDFLFPYLSGQWRITEINYLLRQEEFDIDIVCNLMSFAEQLTGSLISVFGSYYQQYSDLRHYNILIFNPKYNYLNIFNGQVDGTKWNGYYPADFMLTKHENIDWTCYHLAYCIFLDSRLMHHRLINQQLWPTVTKIYPGGGFLYNELAMKQNLVQMNAQNEYVISTQPFITEVLKKYFPQVIEIPGAPIIPFETSKKYKSVDLSPGKLHIAFMALKNDKKKGFDSFLALIQTCPEYQFHVIGTGFNSGYIIGSNVICHGILTPSKLNHLFSTQIDVIVTPVVQILNEGHDGFPLNAEAMMVGCIPIQTDPHGCNQHYQIGPECGLFLSKFDLGQSVKFLKSVMENPEKRITMSRNIIDRMFQLLDPTVQLTPIKELFLSI